MQLLGIYLVRSSLRFGLCVVFVGCALAQCWQVPLSHLRDSHDLLCIPLRAGLLHSVCSAHRIHFVATVVELSPSVLWQRAVGLGLGMNVVFASFVVETRLEAGCRHLGMWGRVLLRVNSNLVRSFSCWKWENLILVGSLTRFASLGLQLTGH